MIELKQVCKSYNTRVGKRRILNGVNLTLARGESLAVMGRNGAGKSTLTRIIGGLDHVDSGEVVRSMTVSWPLGWAGAFQGSLTGADNVRFIARIYGRNIEDMLEKVQSFADLGIYFRMPVKTYSAGMRSRLAFGVSLAVDFECYLVDEITGAGDHRFAERAQKAMAERKANGSLLMISHDPGTLLAYCDRGALLHEGQLRFYDKVEDMIAAYYEL